MSELESFFDFHPLFSLLMTAVLAVIGTLVSKTIYVRWLAKESRVTPEGCSLHQEACHARMLTEWYAFKLEIKNKIIVQDAKMKRGDDYFVNLNTRLDRSNTILEAIINIQLAMCHSTTDIDCEDLTKLLIKQGIEVGGIKRRDVK